MRRKVTKPPKVVLAHIEETARLTRHGRTDITFDVRFTVDEVALEGEAHAIGGPGWNPERPDEFMVSLTTKGRELPPPSPAIPFPVHLTCQGCSSGLVARAAWKVLAPRVAATGSIEVRARKPRGPRSRESGWFLFNVRSVPVEGEIRDLGHKAVGPECVVYWWGIPIECPIHGRTEFVYSDVMD